MFFNKLRNLTLISLLIINPILGEGFVAGTLVRTSDYYVPIEDIKEKDLVTTFDFKKNVLVESEVIKISKKKIKKVIQLTIKGEVLEVAPDHKFYCPMVESSFFKNQWTKAENLKPNQFILSNIKEITRIDKVVEIKKEAQVYCISIKDNHNFFVTEQDILVHNFLIMPALYALGTYIVTTYEIKLTVSFLGMVAYGIGSRMQNGKVKTIGKLAVASGATGQVINLMANNNKSSDNFSGDNEDGGNNNYNDPNNNDDDYSKLPKKAAKILAAQKAAEKGYKKTKDYNFNSHGQEVYQKGNDYISLDVDSHKGGFWKRFSRGRGRDRRDGTYDIDLNEKIGE